MSKEGIVQLRSNISDQCHGCRKHENKANTHDYYVSNNDGNSSKFDDNNNK